MKQSFKPVLFLLVTVFCACTKASPECSLIFSEDDKEIYIIKGESYYMSYDESHKNCRESPVWSSSNSSIAVYEAENRSIRGISYGAAVITCSHLSMDYDFNVYVIGLDKSEYTLTKGLSISLTALPQIAGDKITWTSSDSSIASVDTQGRITARDYGVAIISATGKKSCYGSCTITVPHSSSCPQGAVDLGISAYWATYNLGASKPEDGGQYYAWGETKSKTSMSWSNYVFAYKGSGLDHRIFTKYNTSSSFGNVDNKTVLEKSDDAAYSALGGAWRMPTWKDLDQLINNCSWQTIKVDGQTVLKATSKLPGYESNYILIPDSGYKGYDIYNDGYLFWSSSINQEDPSEAYYLHANINSWTPYMSNSTLYRDLGLHIRPVSD